MSRPDRPLFDNLFLLRMAGRDEEVRDLLAWVARQKAGLFHITPQEVFPMYQKEQYAVVYARPSDGRQVSMTVDGYNDDYAVGMAIKQAVENEGGVLPNLIFVARPVAQGIFNLHKEESDRQAEARGKLGLGDRERQIGAREDLLGVYRNTETKQLDVWVDNFERYGGSFPDTEEGMVAAVAKAAELRAV